MDKFNFVKIVEVLQKKAFESQNEANQHIVKARIYEDKIKQLREEAVKFPKQTNKKSAYIVKYQRIVDKYIELAQKFQKEADKLNASAKKIQSNEPGMIRDLNILHENMSKCKNHNEKLTTCKVVIELIQKYFLQKIKPYSDSWKNCGGR